MQCNAIMDSEGFCKIAKYLTCNKKSTFVSFLLSYLNITIRMIIHVY